MLACLVTLSPLDKTTGERFDVRLATVSDRRVCALGGKKWEPAITQAPAIGMQFWNGDFETGTEAGKVDLSFNMALAGLSEPRVAAAIWSGANIEIMVGRVGAAWPWAIRLRGKVTSYSSPDWPSMRISAEVDTEPFNRDVLVSTYAGTGDAEGGEDLRDRVKPLALGRPRNVEPVLINTVDSVYQFSGYGPIEAVEVLYERAGAFPAASANYATYAELVAADIAPGHWATCLAQGLIRLGAPAAGVITGDISGHAVGAAAPRGAGALVEVMADIAGVDPSLVGSASLAALDAEGSTFSDVMITEQVKFLEAARRLILPCNWQVVVSNLGVLRAMKPAIAELEQFTLHAQGKRTPLVSAISESAVSLPYRKTVMAAERSWRVHSFDEIMFAADLIDRGDYQAATIYREGNIVTMPDGGRWLFVSTNPVAGVTPGSDDAVWSKMTSGVASLYSARLTNDSDVISADANGNVASFAGLGGRFVVEDSAGNEVPDAAFAVSSESGVDVSIDAGTGIYTVLAMGQNTGFATLTATVGEITFEKTYSVAKSLAGAKGDPGEQGAPGEPGEPGAPGEDGAPGTPAVSGFLTNEAVSLWAYANGVVESYAGATSQFRIFSGSADISANFTLSSPSNPQSLNFTIGGRTFAITGGFDPNETIANITFRATGSGPYAGIVLDKVFTLTKSTGGYEIVAALPTSNLFTGRIVFLTTDKKLYRYDGDKWTAKFDADDLLGEVPRENIDPSLLSDISDLQEVYGDTESAAASAAAAQAAQSGAEAARSLAQDAQSDAEAAQSASEQAKQDALAAALAADGSASAANTSAQTASTKAGEAGEKASAAAASATAAQTSAGNASSSATNAASSATNAGTSANSAASSATVAAKSVGYAESGALGNLVHKGRFSDNDVGEWTGSGLSAVNAPGLANQNMSKALQLNGRDAYEGAAMREGNLNKRTLRFRGWVSTTGSAVAARIGLQLVLSDGSTVWRTAHLRDAGLDWASFDVNLNLNYTSLEVTSWRPWINNYGTAGVDTMTSRWAGLFLEDVTESNAAKGSADAAATSASTAATRANEASQSASAASTSETNAATSAGNASTFASQASTSASDALGSKNAAANSAGAAATSATNAGNSASAASTSAQTATTKAGEASQSASAAATSATNANTAAGNASTYAGQASNSADDADGSASAAAQSAGAAATSAGNAGNSASAAASSASSASTSASDAGASASSAASSASVAASTAAGLMNPNPMFADWLDGATFPTRWADWSGGAATISRVAGEVSPYAVRLGSVANDNRGISQTGANAPAALSAGDWVVIEADIKLNSGSLLGAGVLLRGTNTGECRLVFATDPDTKGNTIGAGSSGSVYRFRKLIQVPSGSNSAALYLMNHWSNFGSTASANDITWYRCGWRFASTAEIKTGQIDTLSASVTQQASALASVEGKTVAYWSVLANAGTSNAIIAARADGAGTSNVTMAAQKVVLANLAGTTLYDALVIENGNATLAGKLRAGAVVTDNLAAGAVTAAKINVTDLSAITGNIGTLTTGTIRNAADTYRIDATNGRSIMRAGGYMKVSGAPFGSNSQFLEWYGPEQANLANCTEANAITYMKTNGSAYFGGTLSAGVRKNAAQTTVVGGVASVEIGPFGSGGGARSVVLSFSYNAHYSISNTASYSGSMTGTIYLDKWNGSAWVNLTSATISGYVAQADSGGGASEPGTILTLGSGSLTFTDNSGGTAGIQYRARLANFTDFTINSNVISEQKNQTLGIVSTE